MTASGQSDDIQLAGDNHVASLSKQDLFHVGRGILMGGADVVPGVSGGTVALILGIYPRLVSALSRCDREWIRLITRRQWAQAAGHIDLRFLITLAIGIGAGVLLLGSVMHSLLDSPTARPFTLSVFFGAIVSSSVLVARMIPIRCGDDRDRATAWAIAGGAFAFWLTGFEALTEVTSAPNLFYVFVCGIIGISAMILPGISGAYLLLVLGLYSYLTGILKGMLHGEIATDSVLVVAVFFAGCATGILSFSKLLKRLLASYELSTLAILSGFMLGALRKIWPWESTPNLGETSTWLVVGAAVASAVVVLVLDWLTKGHRAPVSGG